MSEISITDQNKLQLIKDHIKAFPNFPKEGVLFKYHHNIHFIFYQISVPQHYQSKFFSFFFFFRPFRDIFSALLDGKICTLIRDLLVEHVRNSNVKVDAIVGLDARGFLFGFALAAELGLPFVPIRKRGKLPGKCLSHEYSLEYGTGVLELQEDSLRSGQQVLIIDDLLATGGTLYGACQLIRSAGASVAEIIVIIELKSLNGRSTIPGEKIFPLVTYD